MDEKDKQIERLFDDYASSLKPNEKLADSALNKMRDKKSKPKKSRATVWIGAAAACAAVAIAVFSVMSFFGGKGDGSGLGDNSSGSAPSVPTSPSGPNGGGNPPLFDDLNGQQSYSITDVREMGVDISFANNYIDLSVLSDAQIVNEKYYAYYLKNTDEFVYFKAELDISYNGENIQMRIIAENSTFLGNELYQEYGSLMKESDYNYKTIEAGGEYVTRAYCKHGGYKYYVWAKSDSAGAENIAAKIIGIRNAE